MKIALLSILLCIYVSGQDYKKMFDPNSSYLDRGEMEIFYFKSADPGLDKIYLDNKLINERTIAVDPTKILPGSVVFIPEFVGVKLMDGTYHDGYFLAHRVLKNYPVNELMIFSNDKNFRSLNIKTVHVYKVLGVMSKSTQARFELQYQPKTELPTYKMVASDFDRLLKTGNSKFDNIADRVLYYSEKGKGTPYLVFNLGEGADSYVDPDPTIDFARTDCMTFCEHTLALAISTNYSEMYKNLQKIRYKKGLVGYVTRNHYTIVDWLPNNSWLLEDVTQQVGNGFIKEMSKTIDRPGFYKSNGVNDDELINAPQKTDIKVYYVPKENVLQISKKLKGAEIVSIVTNHPDVVSAHMGIIVIDRWGNIIFRHASNTKQTSEVIDERLSDYLDKLKGSKSRVGMIFMRPRQEYKIPN